jgi:hypothetical protein
MMAQQLTIEPTSVIDGNGNLQLTISITPNEQKFMLNELESIENWVSNSVAGKLSKCRKRMIKEWNSKIIPEPVDDSQWLDTITSRSDYDNKNERIKKDKKK